MTCVFLYSLSGCCLLLMPCWRSIVDMNNQEFVATNLILPSFSLVGDGNCRLNSVWSLEYFFVQIYLTYQINKLNEKIMYCHVWDLLFCQNKNCFKNWFRTILNMSNLFKNTFRSSQKQSTVWLYTTEI